MRLLHVYNDTSDPTYSVLFYFQSLLVTVTTDMKRTTTINIPMVFIFRIFLRIDT